MIEDVLTGQLFLTKILPVAFEDLPLIRPGWKFDWYQEVKRAEVFKIVTSEDPATIHGLMSVERCDGYIEVRLLESSPSNVGRDKGLKGIAGSLLSFAAELSFATGGEGFVLLTAKTELIGHYQTHYGFVRQGNTQRMILDTLAAVKLIAIFEKGVT